eukprot:COSAG02_NODE_505_length_20935_cov_38.509119_16_plen_56_part_00
MRLVVLAVPQGWEARATDDGRTFFIDHNTQVRPHAALAQPTSVQGRGEGESDSPR